MGKKSEIAYKYVVTHTTATFLVNFAYEGRVIGLGINLKFGNGKLAIIIPILEWRIQ